MGTRAEGSEAPMTDRITTIQDGEAVLVEPEGSLDEPTFELVQRLRKEYVYPAECEYCGGYHALDRAIGWGPCPVCDGLSPDAVTGETAP